MTAANRSTVSSSDFILIFSSSSLRYQPRVCGTYDRVSFLRFGQKVEGITGDDYGRRCRPSPEPLALTCRPRRPAGSTLDVSAITPLHGIGSTSYVVL